MIDQYKNRRTIATAIAAAVLLLSPGALLATDAEDAQTAATNMVTAAEEVVASSVHKAAKKLQEAATAWKTKADGWKTKADQWANAPDDPDKKTAADNAKEEADKAKASYDGALAALSEARGQDKATFQSDYNAKHFSLVLGAVVLNPFKLESVDTDADPMTTEFRVENGNTDANVLLEAGFRRRWAWENWGNASLRDKSRNLKAIETQLSAENSKSVPVDNMITDLTKNRNELRREIADMRKQAGADEFRFDAPGWDEAESHPELWSRIWRRGRDMFVVPRNYTVRLGFALGSEDPSGAAAVAGSGDFYLETGLGWDWVRALYPTGGEPLRIAFGHEVFASFSNDPELGDFHQRVLVGGHLTAGVPLGEGEERLAEIVVRMGWVSVEVPRFLDDESRLVRVKNEVADFEVEQGFGVDIEMNIPISKQLGYIFLRATSNHGFDPNPWTAVVGYTLPINQIYKLFAGG